MKGEKQKQMVKYDENSIRTLNYRDAVKESIGMYEKVLKRLEKTLISEGMGK